ncbi:MAG: ATP-binding cassette domain-containing protein [Solobacterium sp.]|nr:ATP-binding cassette domain-containing protein [Solobacterium sp.]
MLEIQHLTKVFNAGTVNEKKAVTDLSLTIDDGDYITIVGSNGAGKSTLFNAIAGVFIPDSGRIMLDGTNITFEPDYSRSVYIGRMFQDPLKGTAPHMTIKENLALAYLRAGNPRPLSRISRKDEQLFQDQLKMLEMGLEDRMNVPVGTLSGGQRQALTLLMATIVPPKLLLLDEHTAALDPAAANKVMELTNRIVSEHHMTCMMITHNLKQAIQTGNRTLMMKDGQIVLDLKGEQRKNLTIEDLLRMFREGTHEEFDNDRILLSE